MKITEDMDIFRQLSDYEPVYPIYVKGTKAELGSSYQFEMPEGTKVINMVWACEIEGEVNLKQWAFTEYPGTLIFCGNMPIY